jgi:hypothetical protein
MSTIIKAVESKVDELLRQGGQLLEALESFGWKDKRPRRTKAQSWFINPDPIEKIPAAARVPVDFVRDYHELYAACLALVETNMPSRHKEILKSHDQIVSLLSQDQITFDDQIAMAANIKQILAITGSIPDYLSARLHDIELAVAQGYVDSQLTEADLLLKSGHIRAAGAVAGVLFERHLKLLCDRHQPPIKYTKTAGISKLNDLLKDAAIYDTLQWRKVQWMGDARNACDHAHTDEPRKSDVADLIAEVRKFVALFVI